MSDRVKAMMEDAVASECQNNTEVAIKALEEINAGLEIENKNLKSKHMEEMRGVQELATVLMQPFENTRYATVRPEEITVGVRAKELSELFTELGKLRGDVKALESKNRLLEKRLGDKAVEVALERDELYSRLGQELLWLKDKVESYRRVMSVMSKAVIIEVSKEIKDEDMAIDSSDVPFERIMELAKKLGVDLYLLENCGVDLFGLAKEYILHGESRVVEVLVEAKKDRDVTKEDGEEP